MEKQRKYWGISAVGYAMCEENLALPRGGYLSIVDVCTLSCLPPAKLPQMGDPETTAKFCAKV